jgi:hypothetical protein
MISYSQRNSDILALASALFQAAGWLQTHYPPGSIERTIADVCWQAHEVIDPIVTKEPKGLGRSDQEGSQALDQQSKLQHHP